MAKGIKLDDTGAQRGGYRELLQTNRAFRLLWIAQIASLFGDWFNIIASATLLSHLTGAGAALGGFFAIRMLASFVISPLSGVLADRYNRKYILIVTDLLRFCAVLSLLLVRKPQHAWLLFTLTALQVGIGGVFEPVRTAILPEIASRRLLGAANTLSAVTWSTLLALGAAAGGMFASVFGIRTAFILDALTYLFSAFLLVRMPYTTVKRTIRSKFQSFSILLVLRAGIKEYVEGLRYLLRNRYVLIIALQKAFVLFFFSGFQVASVAIADSQLTAGYAGGAALGLIFAAGGVGSTISPILARWFIGNRQRPMLWTILLGYLLMISAMLLTAPLTNFPIVLIGSTMRGIGGGLIWVFTTQLLLEILPDDLRGRVISSEYAALTLLGAAGSAGAGIFLEWSSIPSALWVMGVLLAAPALHWAIMGIRGQPAHQ